MSSLWDQLLFSASITGPICLMLLLGVVLKRVGFIDENFIEIASKLVFRVTLPAMLFLSIIGSHHDFSASSKLVGFAVIANIAFFFITVFSTGRIFPNADHRDKGVIIQGGFRSNTAIIALAYVANAYGDKGVALAAVYVASLTFLFNVEASIVLSPKGAKTGPVASLMILFKTLTKNPLIISILLGMIFYLLSIPLPKMILDTGHLCARMTLPLALLCAGGSLDISAMRQDKAPAWVSTGYKLILAPLLITGSGALLGFRNMDLGIIFLMSSAPAAAASYAMARAMGGNATLAANIIALTTVCSIVTSTLGIFILSTIHLI